MPSVITANTLRTGAVVYLNADGRWIAQLEDAAIAVDAASFARLESLARDAVERRDVTAVYAFDVRVVDHKAEPVSVREKIRAHHAIPV